MTHSLANRSGSLLAPQLDFILIDGSGSMMYKWWDTLAALDGFIDTLKAQNIASHGIVTVFDGINLDSTQRDSTIDQWPLFSKDPLVTSWGSTPLYDAINLMGRRLKELDPPRASIVIVTDGNEAGSRHTTSDQARAILDWCRAKGWQVTFLGCDFDNARQAALLGSTPQNTIGVRKQKLLEAGKALGEKRVANVRFGTDINFSPDEKENFGGFLADHSNGK